MSEKKQSQIISLLRQCLQYNIFIYLKKFFPKVKILYLNLWLKKIVKKFLKIRKP